MERNECISHSLDPGVPYLSNRQSDRGSDFQPGIPMLYPRLRKMVEEQLGIQVYGYVPELKGFKLESRHLGLKLPEELKELKDQMHLLGEQMEKTVDLDGLLKLAAQAEDIPVAEKKEDLVKKRRSRGKGEKALCKERKSASGWQKTRHSALSMRKI